MESQAFEALMRQLPEEAKVILVLFVLLVLFYPKVVAFFSHFSPQERAIRKARRRREMEELGIALEEAEEPRPATAPPAPGPTPAAAAAAPEPEAPAAKSAAAAPPPSGATGAQPRGFARRLARLQTQQLAWCFAGAFAIHAAASLIAQLQLAMTIAGSFDPFLPYIVIVPNILIFGGVYSLGVSVFGIMFFGDRGRWGSLLLGLGLALLLNMLQVGLHRLMFGWQ